MAAHIHYCSACKKYTLETTCPVCGAKTIRPRPPKYSLADKYGKYRREIKKKGLKEKGLY